MRRYFDLVLAGSVLFLCLFFALILLSVSTTSDSGFLTMFTGFLALVFGAVAGGFQLVFAGLRLIFKLEPRRFWARATLIALAFFFPNLCRCRRQRGNGTTNLRLRDFHCPRRAAIRMLPCINCLPNKDNHPSIAPGTRKKPGNCSENYQTQIRETCLNKTFTNCRFLPLPPALASAKGKP